MAGKRRHQSSRIAATVAAVRRAHRRHTHKVTGAPTIGQAARLAVRDANPRTLGGLTAQGVALSTMAAHEHRGRLAPILGLGVLVPAELLWPASTATGLAVAAVAAGVAAARHKMAAAEREVKVGWRGQALGVAAGSAGMLIFTGLSQFGALDGLPWWQWAGALGASWAPGALAWWRPMLALPEIQPVLESGPRIALPAEMEVLRDVMAEAINLDRSPIAGGRVTALDRPAPGVATAMVSLPGIHTQTLAVTSLRHGLEALAEDAAAGRALGALKPGSLLIEATGVSEIKVTVSWSRELDEQALPWRARPDLPAGMVYLGIGDDRSELIVPLWERGADGRVSCNHVWIIGATNGGKTTTLRSLLAPGIIQGICLPVLLDGKGAGLKDFAPYALGRAVARDPIAWEQAITVVYALLVARQARGGTADAWTGPTPDDPHIALIIDECTSVLAGLSKNCIWMLGEIARMGRELGVSSIQAGQVPTVDSLIGGAGWRAQCRLVLGHGVLDATHNRIATQSGGTEGPSLLKMPIGRAVAMLGGDVLATRAKITLLGADELHQAADGAPQAHINDLDMTPVVAQLLDLAQTWRDSRPTALVDLAGMIAQWVDDPTTTTVARQPMPGSAVPSQGGSQVIDLRETSGAGTRVRAPQGSIRDDILTRLLTTTTLLTRPRLVQELVDAGWSRSGAYTTIGQLIDQGAVIEEAGRLAPAILAS